MGLARRTRLPLGRPPPATKNGRKLGLDGSWGRGWEGGGVAGEGEGGDGLGGRVGGWAGRDRTEAAAIRGRRRGVAVPTCTHPR